VKVLFALSELPQLWAESYAKHLVNYFLNRNVLYKAKKPTEFVTRETGKTIFPFSYRAGLLETLYALAKMGYGGDLRVQNACAILQDHRTSTGRYILDLTPGRTTNRYFYPGQKQTENKWVTFYSYLCLKYKNESEKTNGSSD
jgi:hypothetical protein